MTDPELTRLLAEKVMGWHLDGRGRLWLDRDGKYARDNGLGIEGGRGDFEPLGSIEDAWLVQEKVAERGLQGPYTVAVFRRFIGKTLLEDLDWRFLSLTARERCLAALEAVGVSA
jgi:hypothetical protein